jgi:hypothetical protein
MAIVPIHRLITRDVLEECGFQSGALTRTADANAKVDEKQGRAADEANLHAMRGYVDGIRMQTRAEAERKVAELLEAARREVIEALGARDYARAMTRLGEAHHTTQDREYHQFEPWPFSGIGDALFDAPAGARYGLRPDYLMCHAARDLSFVSGLNYGAGYSSARGWSGAYWAEVTLPTARGPIPYLSIGSYGRAGATGRSGEVAGYVMLTWGAPPRSLRTPATLPGGADLSMPMPSRSFCSEVGEGLGAFERAKAKSRELVEEIRTATGERWSDFTGWSP